MKVEIKSYQDQLAKNKDRISFWVSTNQKKFICSITVEEKATESVITVIPCDDSVKTIILPADPTAVDYEYVSLERDKKKLP